MKKNQSNDNETSTVPDDSKNKLDNLRTSRTLWVIPVYENEENETLMQIFENHGNDFENKIIDYHSSTSHDEGDNQENTMKFYIKSVKIPLEPSNDKLTNTTERIENSQNDTDSSR